MEKWSRFWTKIILIYICISILIGCCSSQTSSGMLSFVQWRVFNVEINNWSKHREKVWMACSATNETSVSQPRPKDNNGNNGREGAKMRAGSHRRSEQISISYTWQDWCSYKLKATIVDCTRLAQVQTSCHSLIEQMEAGVGGSWTSMFS